MKSLIVVLGPTASGKSDLAVEIAKKINGEVVSADSRQIYKGMDLGTGKITKKETSNIKHHLIDVVSPKSKYTVARYQKEALIAIKKIWSKNKIPIICGGTGLYIDSITKGIVFPEVKPNIKLRNILEKKETEELFKILRKNDPKRAASIDKNNRRRLIRALEIIDKIGSVPTQKNIPIDAKILYIGISKNSEELKKLIHVRLLKRIKNGLFLEVKKLRKLGISWKKLDSFGLEYRYVARYLQKQITKNEMIESLESEIRKYSKRQMTWFKRDNAINWIKNKNEALNLVSLFVKKP